MNAQQAVREQLRFWHMIGGQVLGDCGDALNQPVAGAKIGSIGAIYAHAVFSEDSIINGLVQGKPMLYRTGGWDAKVGIALPEGDRPMQSEEWTAATKLDLSQFQPYADAVFAQTDAYLAAVPDAELERKVQGPAGETTVGFMVATILATHFPQHMGEIAAIKGVKGLKGLPV